MKADVQFLSFRPMLGYGTTEIRCMQPKRFLAAAGLSARAGHLLAAPTARCRLLVLHRVRYDSLTRKIVALARRRGTKIVFDIDDFVKETPGSASFAPSIEQTMRLCDTVTVSGSFLRDRVAAFHPDCRILRNKLSRTVIETGAAASRARQPGRTVTIGYFSGSAHHDADFAMIAPALLKLMQANPDVRLVVGGKLQTGPDFHAFGERFRIEPFRPYAEFIGLLDGIDINLAPLDTACDFACARSELKFIEAAAFGVPTVASPSPAFAEAIADGQTGFLCRSGEDWFGTLSRLAGDPALRRSVGEASRAETARAYGPEAGQAEWEALFHSLVADGRPAEQVGCSELRQLIGVSGHAKLRTLRQRLKSFPRRRAAYRGQTE